MKKYLFGLLFVLICTYGFSQKLAQINLKDSCIISGGIIKLNDFKRLCKICPPGVQKVVSFNVSYPMSPPVYGELPCKGNRYNMSIVVPTAAVGKVIVIDKIIGIGMDGKQVELPNITLGFSYK